MAGKQAEILLDCHVAGLIEFARSTRPADRNEVLVLLSLKAGLRAKEIALLEWEMVVDPTGDVGWLLELPDCAAKNRGGRRIPIHPDLRGALEGLHRTVPAGAGPVIRSNRGGAMHPVSIVNWFAAAYRGLGLTGCSSHSGRRTFITRAARLVHEAGGSLRDVQLLAGHRSIITTQRYIDGDTDAQRRLVLMV
jgi:integrase